MQNIRLTAENLLHTGSAFITFFSLFLLNVRDFICFYYFGLFFPSSWEISLYALLFGRNSFQLPFGQQEGNTSL